MRPSVLALLSVLGLSLLLQGCEEEITPAQMTSGEEIYEYYCEDCHRRKGPGAKMEHYADRKPIKPYKIILMIKFGYDQGHAMPVFEQLSERQAGAVATYVHDLHKAAAGIK